MKKQLLIVCLAGMLVLVLAGAALAAEGEAAAGINWIPIAAAVASGLAIAIASFGGAFAQAKAIAAGLKGIARNPGASGKLTTTLIIGLAMIESLVIYALVISLILVFKV